ncbi:hypothetical protein B0920_20520 [Massilia sp. KIM]|uniref:hypothetical protein n=1 Tax=Massilia sp. KIM TaxID=1955422 RepID=UPI00098FC361|nr:hypothetical protein [Massilia sp. KIM]OON59675.1 hypothetical protein B0920_20520 [Massilia sp. KIM]
MLFPLAGDIDILRFLVTTAIRQPRLTMVFALLVLAALAGTMTYTGFLVIGVLAEYLGTGRFVAGLLLGALLARFPWVSQGKLRVVGLLPKPVRRPFILGLLALCLLHFLTQGDYPAAGFTGGATAFLLAYPWMRRALFDRVMSSFSRFGGRTAPAQRDDMVIDAEFKEKKD